MDTSNGSKDVDKKELVPTKASFEEAIEATGFGKFNIFLLLMIIPSSFTQTVEQMSLSYVLPLAECDLGLSLEQKGLLNATTFLGMIISGPFFGAICDIFGRKKLIVYGYLLNGFCQIIAASSTNFMQLMIAKFVCGFIFNGPFSATTTYLSEFHSSKYRARVQLVRGITYSFGFFMLPLVAWIILPLEIDIFLFGYLRIHAWNVYLLCCTCSPLTAALVFAFMPESPKFLMTSGNNTKALEVFQTVYSMNYGKSKSDFPIKELIEENKEIEKSGQKQNLKDVMVRSWSRIKPIFMPPYIFRLLLACTTSLTILTSLHIIKLWVPQILQITNDYQQAHNESSTDICKIIDALGNKNNNETTSTCEVNTDNSFVYLNSMIINLVQMILFVISGFFVNWLGKPRLMTILCIAASISSMGIYFAPSTSIIITLLTLYLPSLDLTGVLSITITLEMFPTNFRAISVSVHLMFARIGSVIASFLFSYLVAAGCLAPFLFCTVLTGGLPFLILLYPNTENNDLL